MKNNRPTIQLIYTKLVRVLWGLLFFTLPVTSFPYFPADIGGKTLVRPLAAYPLILLVILVTLPYLLKKPLPRTFLPLFAFVILAMISSLAAFYSDLEALRGVSLASRFVRNLITLGLGVSFYFTVAILPQSWDDLKFSLRWLYAGFGLAMAWGAAQIVYVVHYSPKYFRLINQLQSLVSSRKLFTTRISGLTFEPKWFAEQITFLLMPWLISAVLTGRSIFPWRYKWLTVEMILLGWASFTLVFTYSRTGLFILAVLVLLSYLLFRTSAVDSFSSGRKIFQRKGIRITELALIVGGLIVGMVLVGSQNPYFSRLWRYFTEARSRNRSYSEYIAFQQRFVYWNTALRTFEISPLLGVGLGNYAFYFDEMLPDQPWDRQKEIVRQITPSEGRDRLITPKNLYARLLAETGLLGTASFSAFLIAILGNALYLWFSASMEQKFWGIGAGLALVVFVFIVFSFDSFSLPNMWVIFGLITAAAHLPDPPLTYSKGD